MSAIQTIVHPTDFSESSAHALRLAGLLARDHGATLVVLHVVESQSHPKGGGDREANPIHESLEERIALLRANDPDLLVHGRIVTGLAVDSTLEVAAETKADLIVMGSHGRTGLGRVLLGSVAERVARQATCPVLILKGPSRWSEANPTGLDRPRFPTIIVPTDFSGRSRGALEVAGTLADEGTRVIVVHVAGPVHVASEGYAEALEQRLQEFTVATRGVVAEHRLLEGDAAEGIVEVAREVEAPLIVIPSHGRTGLDRVRLGSVAEKVLRRASCPVLILRRAAKPGSSPTTTADEPGDEPVA